MNSLIKQLIEYGADMRGAMSRFLDDEELYISCFKTFLDDTNFNELKAAVQQNNYEKAFHCAHTLKGVAGNMGLIPLYNVICDMVEPLRNHDYTNLSSLYDNIMLQFNILKDMLD